MSIFEIKTLCAKLFLFICVQMNLFFADYCNENTNNNQRVTKIENENNYFYFIDEKQTLQNRLKMQDSPGSYDICNNFLSHAFHIKCQHFFLLRC